MKELTLDLKNLRDKIQTNYPNCNLIPSTNVGTNLYMTQMHGLFYGNYGSSHIVDEELSRLYPNQLYFDPEGKETSDREDGFGIRDFFGKRVFADNLLSPGTCNIVIKPICDISNLPYVFKTVEKSKYAAANLLVGSTEKLAEDYYRASMIALENEKAKDAIIFSYRAKELNYQPQNKVDFIIAMLYKQLHPNQSK